MKIITIANQKGGIGKTTTAVILATLFNQQGHKTLLIDTDESANSTDTFRAVIEDTPTLYDVLISDDSIPLQEAIQHTEYGDIVPGDPLLKRANTALGGDIEGLYRLQDKLQELSGYDYVIIDTAPALGELLKNALIATDLVIIPVTADRYAVTGLNELVSTINAVKRRHNPKLKVSGFLLVAYTERTKLGKEIRQDLETLSAELDTKLFNTTISRCIKVNESQNNRVPLIYYDKNCKAAKEYREFYKELLGE